MNDIKRVMHRVVAECMFTDAKDYTDDDLSDFYLQHSEVINEGTKAIDIIIEERISERLGRLITRLREAEGIDPDTIDQVFGVQPEDL